MTPTATSAPAMPWRSDVEAVYATQRVTVDEDPCDIRYSLKDGGTSYVRHEVEIACISFVPRDSERP